MRMARLYVAYTPLHGFLSAGMANSFQDERQVLIAIADGPGLATLAQFLKHSSRYFSDVFVLRGGSGLPALSRARQRASNRTVIRKVVHQCTPDWVCCFNDALPEGQAALEESYRAYDAVGVYGDDGSASYASTRLDVSERQRWLKRLAYGRSFQSVDVLGTSSFIKEAYLMFPEYARPELGDAQLHAIPSGHIRALTDSENWAEYRRQVGLGSQPVPRLDVLVIAPLSTVASQRFADFLKGTLRQCRNLGLRPAVKYHPRETKGDYLEVGADALVVGPTTGAEVLLLDEENAPRLLVGELSTALISARWLLPDIKIRSVASRGALADKRLLTLFRQLRIATDPLDAMPLRSAPRWLEELVSD